jgi:beta-phosphoglucomutase
MTLKAVLFDFNGVIINDEAIHERLLEAVLLEENLRFKPEEFRQYSLGRSDRVALLDLCALRGRVLTEAMLQNLIQRKLRAYQATLETLETLPIYDGIVDFIETLRSAGCKLAIVSGALRVEIELVLTQMGLLDAFSTIVSGDEILSSKPDPEGYLLGVERLQTLFPELELTLDQCLAIEDSFPGIQAAKAAGLGVVGVANTYPFHMLHRMATWAVDSLIDLDLDRFLPLMATTSEDLTGIDSEAA